MMLKKGDVVRHWFAGRGRVESSQRGFRRGTVRVRWESSGQVGNAYTADCIPVKNEQPVICSQCGIPMVLTANNRWACPTTIDGATSTVTDAQP